MKKRMCFGQIQFDLNDLCNKRFNEHYVPEKQERGGGRGGRREGAANIVMLLIRTSAALTAAIICQKESNHFQGAFLVFGTTFASGNKRVMG
jgi:hypothetical protein